MIFERTRRRGGTAVYIEVRDRQGRKRRELIGAWRTRAQRVELMARARVVEAQRRNEVVNGTFVPAPERRRIERGAQLTVAELGKEFLNVTAPTVRSDFIPQRVAALTERFGNIPVKNMTDRLIDSWIAERLQEVSGSTVRRDWAVLRRMLTFAKRRGYIEDAPSPTVRLPRESAPKVRVLTDDEIENLIQAAPAWLRPWIEIADGTGWRLGELAHLRWTDYDAGQQMLTDAGEGKTAVSRRQRVPGALAERIEQLPRLAHGYILGGPHGESPITERTRNRVSRQTLDLMKKLGIEGASFHTLRHSAATRLAAAGVELPVIAALLGHRCATTTWRYAHPGSAGIERAVDLLGRARPTQRPPVSEATS